MKITIDLKSDTVTLPPREMLQAITEAELGDDFYHEDPTTKRLEKKCAELLGKEAALLVLSGTMGNLSCVMAQAAPGTEAIVEADAHMFRSEAGGIARIAGVVPRRVPGVGGIMDPAVVEKQITKRTVLNGGTSIISIEDTHNGAGGVVIPLENLAETKKLAEKHGLLVHMDGARIFNAAVALGVTVAEVAKHVDSLSFCLSKGLACPLGAVICGTAEMIDRARHVRQVLGGGMRQAGVMAQTGIWALDNMVERLSEDHENASLLAQLAVEAGFGVNLDSVQTNMVRVNTSPLTSEQFRQNLLAHGIDVLVAAPDTVRFVTHWGITREHILETGELMKQMQK